MHKKTNVRSETPPNATGVGFNIELTEDRGRKTLYVNIDVVRMDVDARESLGELLERAIQQVRANVSSLIDPGSPR